MVAQEDLNPQKGRILDPQAVPFAIALIGPSVRGVGLEPTVNTLS